jgi:hypothetical protein
MGLDIRDIPSVALDSLPAHLRNLGFEVAATQRPNLAPSGGILTEVSCRRGPDVQRLAWASLETMPGIKRIAISNQSGWVPWVRRRRVKLQTDITQAIEQLGGYWPYPS